MAHHRQGAIALGSVGDRQQFGLPMPIDAQAIAGKLLSGRRVTAAEVRPESSDLVLQFDGERRLELFNNSSGYEGWTSSGPDGKQTIAQGGGGLVAGARAACGGLSSHGPHGRG
jgi:hypothetical protein